MRETRTPVVELAQAAVAAPSRGLRTPTLTPFPLPFRPSQPTPQHHPRNRDSGRRGQAGGGRGGGRTYCGADFPGGEKIRGASVRAGEPEGTAAKLRASRAPGAEPQPSPARNPSRPGTVLADRTHLAPRAAGRGSGGEGLPFPRGRGLGRAGPTLAEALAAATGCPAPVGQAGGQDAHEDSHAQEADPAHHAGQDRLGQQARQLCARGVDFQAWTGATRGVSVPATVGPEPPGPAPCPPAGFSPEVETLAVLLGSLT